MGPSTVSTTFRAKLLFVVGTAALTLLVVVGGSTYIGIRQTKDPIDVEGRLVPRMKLGPELESEFERLTRSIQDAVAAQDRTAWTALSWSRATSSRSWVRRAKLSIPATQPRFVGPCKPTTRPLITWRAG